MDKAEGLFGEALNSGADLFRYLAVCSLIVCAAAWPGVMASQEEMPATASVRPVFLFMLSNDVIQREIGLSGEQKEQLSALTREYVSIASERRGRRLASTESMHRVDGTDESNVAVRKLEDKVRAVLLPAQLTRLEQLRLQTRAVWAFFERPVHERLALDQEFLATAKSIIQASETECQQLAAQVRTSQLSVKEVIPRVDQIRREAFLRVVALLTPEQRREFYCLLGEKPAFDPMKLRFRLVLNEDAQ